MSGQRQQNGGNGDDASHVFDDMTMAELAKILLEDNANVERNLSGQMKAMDVRLGGEIGKLGGRMDKLENEFGSLRMEVHQNQITFMKSHDVLEKRVEVLEEKV